MNDLRRYSGKAGSYVRRVYPDGTNSLDFETPGDLRTAERLGMAGRVRKGEPCPVRLTLGNGPDVPQDAQRARGDIRGTVSTVEALAGVLERRAFRVGNLVDAGASFDVLAREFIALADECEQWACARRAARNTRETAHGRGT